MHFFVAKLHSFAVMTYTYVRHIRHLRPMNRLIYYAYSEYFSYAKTHATAARALTRDPTVV